jgi:MYXO-CTERM domain-containing protein
MVPHMKRIASLLVLLGLNIVAASARADLAIPGQNSVEYSFKVTGLPAAGDLVLLAYPCGSSSGRPSTNVHKIDEGVAVTVGRRGGDCALYVTSKAKYAAFSATYKPTDSYEDKPLADFMGKATKCKGAPKPTHFVSDPDRRKSIEESLVVKTMTASACEVIAKPSTETVAATSATTAPSAPSAAATTSSVPSVASPTASTPVVSSVAPSTLSSATSTAPASSPPQSKGCSNAPGSPGGFRWAALGVVALVAGLRRYTRRRMAA